MRAPGSGRAGAPAAGVPTCGRGEVSGRGGSARRGRSTSLAPNGGRVGTGAFSTAFGVGTIFGAGTLTGTAACATGAPPSGTRRGAAGRVATTGRAIAVSGGRTEAAPAPATKLTGCGFTGSAPCTGFSCRTSTRVIRASCTPWRPKPSWRTATTALFTVVLR